MKKIFLFLSFISCHFFAQSQVKIANIGDFTTIKGAIIKDCKIGYLTLGQLNSSKSNAILFPTYFSGKSTDIKGSAAAWVDTTKFCVILVDALGNGISSAPSNTENFPEISIRDMVNSQYIFLTKTLSISHLHAIMGVSMGGMQTFEWMVAYPNFMTKAIPIVGSPKQSYYDVLLWKAEWDAIETAGNNPDARREAMRKVAEIHNLHLFTPAYWNKSKKADEAYNDIQKMGDDYTKGNHPENWISQIKAMLGQDIYQSSGKSMSEISGHIKAQTMIIVATQDQMVNPASAIELGKILNVKIVELTGNCGHVATACESDKVREAVRSFL
ncbi:alpha/beta hydrolase fold containing protein [Emticicia oligotrophica DSM 17448]|uniref:Alpha/beta hydrolase fold containing protein n=1 Tax=Emticicia oligotrophica (strain DSM 17448 / CIP 109782 / MTCC 6937 / GPTSA100-15) TaxID=929562 RepID=A0ABN4AJJ7_EMTOG|nr:alpha/beta fold hydrolase [Emticicia oligotrophica]AFK02244.1 alpha/beta hydrolase fold containing protein [Emticicia oligotrophica DSM 17448]